ncbi:hypothetical protein ABZZ04_02730 [Streptomyces sp. NPDC006435]|uniref:hypothetical protein n=1 Tax=Streptomyces sp. NPDC006435 TaxID=3154300 RepID=UPI0033B1086A
MKRRWVWMLVLSIPSFVASGLAVAAFARFVADGSAAEFWLPGRGTDNMATAWGASIAYGLLAALGFSMAWSLSQNADRPDATDDEDPSRESENP